MKRTDFIESKATIFSRRIAYGLGQEKNLTTCATMADRQEYSRFARILEALLNLGAVLFTRRSERHHCEASWWRETQRNWHYVGELNNSDLTDFILQDVLIVTIKEEVNDQQRDQINEQD